MDIHDDLHDELECGICMELYKEPKTLPCIHNFCRNCVTRHVISQRQHNERIKGFLCPLCRFYVKVPRPDKPMEQWALQLPNNTSIPRLIDILLSNLKNKYRCVYHPEEHYSSYCTVCRCLACTKCLGERHPSCTGDSFCSVKQISLKMKTDMLTRQRDLDIEQKRMIENVDLVRSVVSGLKDAECKMVEDIQERAQRSVQNITQQEAELIDHLDLGVEEQLKGIKLTKNPVDEAADILRHHKEEMDALLKSSTGVTYLDNLELAKERHRECMETIQRLKSSCRPPTITFIERESVTRLSIGTLVSPSLTEDFLAGDITADTQIATEQPVSSRDSDSKAKSPAMHNTHM